MTLEERKKVFNNVFHSHEGKLLMEILINDFQHRVLFDSDPLKMAYKAGQYELVQYLIDMSGDNNE